MRRHAVLAHHDLEAELEREEQLVALEEPAARVLVHGVRVVRVDLLAALGHGHDLGRVRVAREVHREVEERDVRVERELVHRVDAAHVVEHEVRDARADRRRAVALARGVDLDLGLLGDLELLRHLLRRRLGRLERVDEVGVVEQRALRLGEQPQDLVLEVDELLLALRDAHRELGLLRLEVRLLLLHDVAEQLRLEPLLLHGEVDDRRLGRDLGRVVRVAELGRDVQLEVVRVVELLVAELKHLAVADLHDRLGEHGLERRVELLEHVLQQDRRAVRDGVLDGEQEVLHLEVDHLEPVRLLHAPHPLVRLALRVDHERPAVAARDDHAVLGREQVGGQALQLPAAHVDRARAERRKRGALREGQPALLDLDHPPGRQPVAVHRVEGPEVRERGRRDEHVADALRDARLEAADALLPAVVLARQALDELVRAVEQHLHRVGLGLELVLLADRVVVLLLERLDLRDDLGELRLRGREARLLLREPVLRRLEPRALRRDLLRDVRVDVDRVAPRAQRARRLGDAADALGRELGVGDELLHLVDDLRRDVVLVVLLDLHEEVRLAELLLRRVPVALAAEVDHHALHAQLDLSGRLGVRLHLGDRALVELVDLSHRLLERGQRDGEVLLRVVRDRLALDLLLADPLRVGLDRLLLLLRRAALRDDHDEQRLAVLLLLRDDHLLLLELGAHDLDAVARLDELREAVRELVALRAELAALLGEQLLVALDELEEVRRRDVVVPLELVEHLVGRRLDRDVHGRERGRDALAEALVLERDALEEAQADRGERVLRPRREPVDRRVVDQRRVEAAARARVLADG